MKCFSKDEEFMVMRALHTMQDLYGEEYTRTMHHAVRTVVYDNCEMSRKFTFHDKRDVKVVTDYCVENDIFFHIVSFDDGIHVGLLCSPNQMREIELLLQIAEMQKRIDLYEKALHKKNHPA